MHERIRELRKTLNLTLTDFGSQIGLKANSLCDIEHKRCNITERVIISICAKFNVNEIWLKTGAGNMFNDNKKFIEFFEIYKSLSAPLQDFLIKVAIDLLNTQDKL